MATLNFLGSKLQSFKDDGSVNASGTVEFFAVGGAFSTYVSSYTSSSFATANSNTVTLDAAGRADCWLNTDADVRVRDSAGVTIDTQLNINPDSSASVVTDNLPANASFEDDASGDLVPDEWAVTTYTGGSVAVDTADRSHGKNSLKFISVGNGGGTATTADFFPVMAAGTLYWAFDLKSTADVRNLVQLLWYDASQVALGSPSTDLYDNSTTNPTSWTRQFGTVAVPATAYFAKFRFFGAHSSDATSGTVRLDNVRVSGLPETGNAIAFSGNNTHSGTVTMSGKSLWTAEGAAVASDAGGTTDIWTTDGNTVHVTGTNAITSLGTAPQAGAYKMVIFDGALTLTHGANLNIPGQANITTAANDWMLVYADTTTQHDVVSYTKATGASIVPVDASSGASVVTITSQTASASATLNFTTTVDWTLYDIYEFDLINLRPATDAVYLRMLVTKDAGSSWEAGASDYQVNIDVTNSAASGDSVKSGGATQMILTDDAVGIGNDAGQGVNGKITLYAPNAASKAKTFDVSLSYYDAAGNYTHSHGNCSFLDGAALGTGAPAINGVQFLMSGGNIASGTIRVRGIRNS